MRLVADHHRRALEKRYFSKSDGPAYGIVPCGYGGGVRIGAGYGWMATNSADWSAQSALVKTLTDPVGVILKTLVVGWVLLGAGARSATKRLPNASKAKPRRSPSPNPEAKVVFFPLGVIFTILPPSTVPEGERFALSRHKELSRAVKSQPCSSRDGGEGAQYSRGSKFVDDPRDSVGHINMSTPSTATPKKNAPVRGDPRFEKIVASLAPKG